MADGTFPDGSSFEWIKPHQIRGGDHIMWVTVQQVFMVTVEADQNCWVWFVDNKIPVRFITDDIVARRV